VTTSTGTHGGAVSARARGWQGAHPVRGDKEDGRRRRTAGGGGREGGREDDGGGPLFF